MVYYKMIAALVIAFVVTRCAYCRSLPPQSQSSDIIIELSNRNPVPLIRQVRQSGFDYNPYDMFPDTGSNPNTYPQQQQQQQSTNNNGFPFAVNQFPTIFGKK